MSLNQIALHRSDPGRILARPISASFDVGFQADEARRLSIREAVGGGPCMNKRRVTRRRLRAGISGWLAVILLAPLLCSAQTKEAAPEEPAAVPLAPVTLDGETLFMVRGVSAFPAEKRAAAIADRIRAAAMDPAYVTGSIKAVEGDGFTTIEARGRMLTILTDADAIAEGVGRAALVRAVIPRIDEAIAEYRQARGREALVRGGLRAAAVLAGFVIILLLFLWRYRRGE